MCNYILQQETVGVGLICSRFKVLRTLALHIDFTLMI